MRHLAEVREHIVVPVMQEELLVQMLSPEIETTDQVEVLELHLVIATIQEQAVLMELLHLQEQGPEALIEVVAPIEIRLQVIEHRAGVPEVTNHHTNHREELRLEAVIIADHQVAQEVAVVTEVPVEVQEVLAAIEAQEVGLAGLQGLDHPVGAVVVEDVNH